jgi:Rieske 2Fe-2S family protein
LGEGRGEAGGSHRLTPDRDERIAIKEAKLDLAEQPILFMDGHPEMERTPVSTEPYVSVDYFEKERENIFRRTWINVARESDVAEPNDYLVREVQIARTSVLIVRGKDNIVRAFHNMCSHRGNKMEWDVKGCSKFHDCKFHGWIYDSSGRLVDVPDEANFFNLDKSTLGLTPIHLDVWQGFVFINLDKEPEQSLR